MNESDMPQFPRRADLHASESVYRQATTPGSPESAAESTEESAELARLAQPGGSTHLEQPSTTSIPSGQAPERTGLTAAPSTSAPVRRPIAPVSSSRVSVDTAENADVAVSAETTGIRSRRIEQERKRARRRVRNRRIRTFIIIALVFALISGAVYFAWNTLGSSSSISTVDDYEGTGVDPVEIVVFEGALGTDIGEELIKHDVVKSMDAFLRAFEANKAASSIRPGTYSLKTKMSASEAIAALLDESNRTDNTVTVIPGQTVKQLVDKMKEVTDFDAAAIDAAVADPTALGLPAEANGVLEGWLAPGSYELSTDETPVTLLKEMVDARIAQFNKLGIPEGKRQQLLIKASILEREVNKSEYLPKVARVIENRLADPAGETVGRLQMDSTVLYGVGKTGGIPTAEDLASDTPYNTYKIQGLPAGPISNPRLEALEAMNAPADGTWLYFVTIDLVTGETRFASTSAEHEANKALLDEYCAAHQDVCFK